MSAPLIAIVGRPNVGKSTLFNRIVGGRKALVHDTPGLTRDRRYGEVDYYGVVLRVVDTGGLDPEAEREVIGAGIHRQARRGIDEADLVLFVVDATAGVNPLDQEVARMLRKVGKPIVTAANKVDSAKRDALVGELYGLGMGDVFPISAAHGRGVDDLIEAIIAKLKLRRATDEPDEDADADGEDADANGEDADDIDAAAADGDAADDGDADDDGADDDDADDEDGDDDALPDGALADDGAIDADAAEVDEGTYVYDDDDGAAEPDPEPEPDTSDEPDDEAQGSRSRRSGRRRRDVPLDAPIRVAFLGKPNAGKSSIVNRLLGYERSLVHHEPGTTTDPVDTPFRFGRRDYVLVDTAGMRRRARVEAEIEKIAVAVGQDTIRTADVAVLVIDADLGPSDQDAHLAGFIEQAGRGVVILLNKSDLLQGPDAGKRLRERIKDVIHFLPYAPVVLSSALRGDGVDRLMDTVNRVAAQHRRRIPTSQLNHFFAEVVELMPPPIHRGSPVRIHYLTQAATAPPTFVAWANQPRGVSESYRRFLINRLRERYGFKGTPLRVFIKAKIKTEIERKGRRR